MKITAQQLIEELQKVPGDTEVQFEMDEGCCGEYMELDLSFAEAYAYTIKNKPSTHCFRIRMESIRGFTSCIKASATKEFIKSLYGDKE